MHVHADTHMLVHVYVRARARARVCVWGMHARVHVTVFCYVCVCADISPNFSVVFMISILSLFSSLFLCRRLRLHLLLPLRHLLARMHIFFIKRFDEIDCLN